MAQATATRNRCGSHAVLRARFCSLRQLAEGFVAAVDCVAADATDRDVDAGFAQCAADVELIQRIERRLIEAGDGVVERGDEFFLRQHHLVMLGADGRGERAGGVALVERRILHRHAERANPFAGRLLLLGEIGDAAGIDAAGEEDADGGVRVRLEVELHDLAQLLAEGRFIVRCAVSRAASHQKNSAAISFPTASNVRHSPGIERLDA